MAKEYYDDAIILELKDLKRTKNEDIKEQIHECDGNRTHTSFLKWTLKNKVLELMIYGVISKLSDLGLQLQKSASLLPSLYLVVNRCFVQH